MQTQRCPRGSTFFLSAGEKKKKEEDEIKKEKRAQGGERGNDINSRIAARCWRARFRKSAFSFLAETRDNLARIIIIVIIEGRKTNKQTNKQERIQEETHRLANRGQQAGETSDGLKIVKGGLLQRRMRPLPTMTSRVWSDHQHSIWIPPWELERPR